MHGSRYTVQSDDFQMRNDCIPSDIFLVHLYWSWPDGNLVPNTVPYLQIVYIIICIIYTIYCIISTILHNLVPGREAWNCLIGLHTSLADHQPQQHGGRSHQLRVHCTRHLFIDVNLT